MDKVEQAVLSAIENESDTIRENGWRFENDDMRTDVMFSRAYVNAAVYAEQYGVSLESFREFMKETHFCTAMLAIREQKYIRKYLK